MSIFREPSQDDPSAARMQPDSLTRPQPEANPEATQPILGDMNQVQPSQPQPGQNPSEQSQAESQQPGQNSQIYSEAMSRQSEPAMQERYSRTRLLEYMQAWGGLDQNPLKVLEPVLLKKPEDLQACQEILEESWAMDEENGRENEWMLEHLEERSGILVPDWWEGKPEDFARELVEEWILATASSSRNAYEPAKMRSLILEALLSMTADRR